MEPSHMGRLTTIVIFVLAGCGEQSQTMDALPQGSSAVRPVNQHGKSASGLIYISGIESSYVLSYPGGKFLGAIKGTSYGACSDTSGNVFLTGQGTVAEYRHGSTKPVRTLSMPNNDSGLGCSVDPITGNLAVTFLTNSGVAVFINASGNATTYSTDEPPLYCGYDNQGNLFIDGSSNNGLWLAELPKGGSAFSDISVSPTTYLNIGQIQWDGTYLTVEVGIGEKHPLNAPAIERLSISGSVGEVVSETTFRNVNHSAFASWIYGNRVLAPLGLHSAIPDIGVWPYPKGGKARKVIKKAAGPTANFTGVTISVGNT